MRAAKNDFEDPLPLPRVYGVDLLLNITMEEKVGRLKKWM